MVLLSWWSSGGIQGTSGNGSELGVNSDKSRYFYLRELRVQFTGEPQGIKITWRAVVQKRFVGSINFNGSRRGIRNREVRERRTTRTQPPGSEKFP